MQQEEQSAVKRVTARLQSIISAVSSGQLPTANGVSLLDVKYHTLLDYFSNYAYYMLLKSQATSIKEHPIVTSLITMRVHLEKMKPLEAKIKYQIDKLVKGAVADTNPLSFKPNLLALQPASSAPLDQDDHDDHEPNEQSTTYKPPKIAPMYFRESSVSKSTLLTTQQIEKASRSRLITEMRSQFSRMPEEITSHGTGYAGKSTMNAQDEQWQEREAFEEGNMMRLSETKESKRLRKAVERGAMGRFNDEFTNLEEDFKSLGGIKHAVALDEGRKARGVLRKSESRAELYGEGKSSRGVDEFVQKESRGAKRVSGKDEYQLDVKKMKHSTKRSVARARDNKD